MKRKRIISYTIAIILLAIFYFLFLTNGLTDWFSNNACKTLTNRIKELNIVGIVSDKYLDKKSHLHETVIVNNKEKNKMFIIPNDKSGLYSFIEMGDSIFKEKKSLECYVKRDSISKKFEIDFGCK